MVDFGAYYDHENHDLERYLSIYTTYLNTVLNLYTKHWVAIKTVKGIEVFNISYKPPLGF